MFNDYFMLFGPQGACEWAVYILEQVAKLGIVAGLFYFSLSEKEED